jgi:hypothetical protein
MIVATSIQYWRNSWAYAVQLIEDAAEHHDCFKSVGQENNAAAFWAWLSCDTAKEKEFRNQSAKAWKTATWHAWQAGARLARARKIIGRNKWKLALPKLCQSRGINARSVVFYLRIAADNSESSSAKDLSQNSIRQCALRIVNKRYG